MSSLKKVLLVFCLVIIIGDTVYSQLTTSYSDRACLGLQTFTCKGAGDRAEWRILPSGEDFIYFVDVSSTTRTATRRIGGETAIGIFNSNTITGNFTALLVVSISNSLEGARVSCRGLGSTDIGILIIQIASTPSAPHSFYQLNRLISSSSVDVTLGWNAPNNTGGANIVSYTVTISPPVQLPASVVSTTTAIVFGAEYNVLYNVCVVATNCIGMSTTPGVFTFQVGRCPTPVAPSSGLIGPMGNRLVGSTVTFQCGPGFEPSGLVTATCMSTLIWSPDPATFQCTTTSAQGTVMFSTIQLAISLVVTFISSALIGLAVGVCGACLIMHKRSSLAMDQMNKPAEPAEYEEVQPNPWNIGVNAAYSTVTQS